jgi:SAM-dependent methyltransferase
VDYLVSLAGLHHEPDLSAVFAEMKRLLKCGGRAVIADVAVDTGPARFLNGFVDRNNPQGHAGRFLDDTTAGLLGEARFTIAEDCMVEVPWLFDTFAEAGAFCEKLFGISGPSAEKIAGAMAEDIGFDDHEGRLRLKWTLRRIVCDAA